MTEYLKLKYSKLEFIIAKLSVKYDGFTDYLFNKAQDYFSLGYIEFKIYLFLYCLFDGRPTDYSKEFDSFREIIKYDHDKFINQESHFIIYTRSKIIDEIKIFIRFLSFFIFSKKSTLRF